MAFEVYGAATSGNGSKKESNVDWNAYNEYIVEKAGLQTKKAVIGVIGCIVDLGLQPLPDAEYDVDKEDVDLSEDELKFKYEDAVIKHQNGEVYGFTFGKVYDGQKKEYVLKKLVKQPPRQCVAFGIDIPSKQLDKGQFFGDTSGETKPLRIWMGGSYYVKGLGKTVIQNLTPIKKTKDDKLGWTINPKNLIYKLAVATGVINETQPFNAEDIDKLVGKAAQFEASVGFNYDKVDKSKRYLFEKIKLMGQIMEGMPIPTLDKTSVIQFNGENNLEDLKEIRAHVKNTIKNALNYEGSPIQKQLEELENGGGATKQNAETSVNASDEDDDDIDF